MTKSNKTENFVLASKVTNWKEKAKARRKENERLKKRQKELIASRANWKSKYQVQKALVVQLKKQQNEQKHIKPKNHSYPIRQILLVVWLRSSSQISLRSCQKLLTLLQIIYGLSFKVPSKASIQNWEQKLAYHRVVVPSNKRPVGKWAILIDESICIGSQKVLLILGIPLEQYTFGAALQAKDIHVLQISIDTSWNGEAIAKELTALQSKGYKIAYSVSDEGNNLKKGISTCSIVRLSDCTHAFGNILKRHYEKSAEFTAFIKACNVLRKQVVITTHSFLSPPTMRSKAKFLNLWERAQWAYQLVTLVEQKSTKLTSLMYQRLAWMKDYKELISKLYLRCQTINKLYKILKNKGLSNNTADACRTILKKEYVQNGGGKNDFFVTGVRTYLDQQLQHLTTLSVERVVCSSDIIESFFGKYKERAKKAGKLVTQDCLCIANFSEQFTEKEIKRAMEKVKIVDLQEWKKQHCPENIRMKRKTLFKNAG